LKREAIASLENRIEIFDCRSIGEGSPGRGPALDDHVSNKRGIPFQTLGLALISGEFTGLAGPELLPSRLRGSKSRFKGQGYLFWNRELSVTTETSVRIYLGWNLRKIEALLHRWIFLGRPLHPIPRNAGFAGQKVQDHWMNARGPNSAIAVTDNFRRDNQHF
jgi:hypothetical protein